MKPETAQRLVELNRQFYESFAADFSATRRRLQPGVLRALADLPPEASILDVGCGNGALALWLARRNHRGRYVGMDFSDSLLAAARAGLYRFPDFPAEFVSLDLSAIPDAVPPAPPFDRVAAFAVLHHLPGEEARLAALKAIRSALTPRGHADVSTWQFLHSAKLRARIVPWEEAGLSAERVDEGDYLLDWRRGGRGVRYVHHIGEKEMKRLAEAGGLKVSGLFYSDGEGGRLGLYFRLVAA